MYWPDWVLCMFVCVCINRQLTIIGHEFERKHGVQITWEDSKEKRKEENDETVF